MAVLVEEDVAGEGVLGDDQGRAVEVHHAQAAGVDAGQRPEATVGRGGGLAGAAQQKQGRAVGVEDEDVGLAVAVDVEHLECRRVRSSTPRRATSSTWPQRKGREVPDFSRVMARSA